MQVSLKSPARPYCQKDLFYTCEKSLIDRTGNQATQAYIAILIQFQLIYIYFSVNRDTIRILLCPKIFKQNTQNQGIKPLYYIF